MLNPIKAFDHMNSTIQRITGYSFSISNLKNISIIAVPVIALVGTYLAVNAEDLSESYLIECCCNFEECITLCAENAFLYENYFGALGKCARVCVKHFP